jgi:hypothetical protein
VARRVAGFMTLVVTIAAPVVTVVQVLVRGILRIFGVQAADAHPFAAHEEIAGAIALHHYEGAVETADRDRLLGALDLAQRSVDEVMTHRRDVETIDLDRAPAEIIAAALGSEHTRIPLWRGSPENIVGVLHTKDLSRAMHAALRSGGVAAGDARCRVDRDEALLHSRRDRPRRPAARLHEDQDAPRDRHRRVRGDAGTGDAGGHPRGDRRRHRGRARLGGDEAVVAEEDGSASSAAARASAR